MGLQTCKIPMDELSQVVVPSENDLALVKKEIGVRRYSFYSGYTLGKVMPVNYVVHVVDNPRDFHMKHLMITILAEGRVDPVGFGDTKISHFGEYYDLNHYYDRGCFGSRNESLPKQCLSWEFCETGVPFSDTRFGRHNPGGENNLVIVNQTQKMEMAKNLIATAREVAARVGAKFFAHNGEKILA